MLVRGRGVEPRRGPEVRPASLGCGHLLVALSEQGEAGADPLRFRRRLDCDGRQFVIAVRFPDQGYPKSSVQCSGGHHVEHGFVLGGDDDEEVTVTHPAGGDEPMLDRELESRVNGLRCTQPDGEVCASNDEEAIERLRLRGRRGLAALLQVLNLQRTHSF